MKKVLLHSMLAAVLLLSIKTSFADSCTDISKEFDGKWSYIQSDVEHIIEFKKDDKYLTQDGIQKEMWLCSYFPNLNLISFYLKNEYNAFNIKKPKQNSKSNNENLKISINFKDSDLIRYIEENKDVTSDEPTTAFKWESTIGMDGHIFPSLIISTATWSDEAKKILANNKRNKKLEVLGDPLGLFIVAVNNIKPDTKIKVEVSLGNIANNSIYEGVLKQENKIYVIKPSIDYNYQQLLAMKQPAPLNAKFTLYLDGEKIGEQIKTITVRSINDAPIAAIEDSKIVDTSWVFAAYVNENNPYIDSLLREAINTGEINRFAGYQGDPQEVYQQVYAIWNVLQRRGVKYSSITTPTAVSNKIFSQYVRFFDDSLNTAQANCIDGTVLFASILRRIGINPKIILVPGHAFLGFDLNSNGNQVGFLETTMIGLTDLGKQGENLDDTFSKLLGVKSIKNQNSYNGFVSAIREGENKAKQAWPKLMANNDPNYKIIDIDKARKTGVTPINH